MGILFYVKDDLLNTPGCLDKHSHREKGLHLGQHNRSFNCRPTL